MSKSGKKSVFITFFWQNGGSDRRNWRGPVTYFSYFWKQKHEVTADKISIQNWHRSSTRMSDTLKENPIKSVRLLAHHIKHQITRDRIKTVTNQLSTSYTLLLMARESILEILTVMIHSTLPTRPTPTLLAAPFQCQCHIYHRWRCFN